MKDIVFYNLDFEKLYILPQCSGSIGYTSCNAQKVMNGLGSIEFVFYDNALEKIIKQNRDGLMMEWNGLFWLFCAYREESKGTRVTGESLNGLLRRSVIPNLTADALAFKWFMEKTVLPNIPWLEYFYSENDNIFVDFNTTTYMTADEFFDKLFSALDVGYEITADVKNKKFVLHTIHQQKTELLLSDDLLNIYDYSETYINRSVAYGGWYSDVTADGSSRIWQYITLKHELSGIDKIDVVLKSTNYTDAIQELKAMKAKTEVEFKTKNIEFRKDYNLGNIVRVQNKQSFANRCVSGVIMSQENGYIENPIFSEVKDNDDI